jgi:hypothetical protein
LNNVIKWPGLLSAPGKRNDTVGAKGVAAGGDRHEGMVFVFSDCRRIKTDLANGQHLIHNGKHLKKLCLGKMSNATGENNFRLGFAGKILFDVDEESPDPIFG